MKTKKIAQLIILCFFCFACKKQEVENPQIELFDTPSKTTHTWFYFNSESFSEVDTIFNQPKSFLKPWTESCVITDGTTFNDVAYFSVNKKGLLVCEGDKITLKTDSKFFDKNTIGLFLIQDGEPLFHLYKNETFNNAQKDLSPIFVYFNAETGIFYPFLRKSELKISQKAEVVSSLITKDKLYFSVKDSSGASTEFDYFYLDNENFSNLDFVSQVSNNLNYNSESVKSISESDFLAAIEPLSFEQAPEQIQNLLKIISKNFDFMLKVHFEDGNMQKYVQGNPESENIMEANAIISPTFCSALFSDGTFYFAGATKNQHILNGENPVCMRLPKLPRGYKYTNFAITQNYLYASYEEYDFYQAGNAGFIQVDLLNTLYKAE